MGQNRAKLNQKAITHKVARNLIITGKSIVNAKLFSKR